ncbi:MAG: DsrE family protein [Bacillota bacterium]
MKLGIIIQTKEYEKAWSAMRFAVTAKKAGHEVKVFLVSEGVEIVNLAHETFDVAAQISIFHELEGQLLACGSCLRLRSMDGTEVCPLGKMINCVEMVEWADKVVTF